MIFVLSTADFSANNIGQIPVPRELTAFTKNAIKASGNTSMTEEQKLALDDFFINIGAPNNSGIFSKLEVLILPMICTDVTKAFTNFKDNSVIPLSSTSFTLQNNGIKSINDSIIPGFTVNRGLKNSCMMIYNTELYDNSETRNLNGAGLGTFSANNCAGFRTITIVGHEELEDRTYISGNVYISAIPSTIYCNTFKGMIAKSFRDSKISANYAGTLYEKNLTEEQIGAYSNTLEKTFRPFVSFPSGGGKSDKYSPAGGAASFGAELTNEEMQLYSDSLDNLFNAFSNNK